jgi:hypothetical protein
VTLDCPELEDLAAIYLGFGTFAATSGAGYPSDPTNPGPGWASMESELLLGFALVLAVQGRKAEVADGIGIFQIGLLGRGVSFFEGQDELIRTLRSRPGRLIERVRWIGA